MDTGQSALLLLKETGHLLCGKRSKISVQNLKVHNLPDGAMRWWKKATSGRNDQMRIEMKEYELMPGDRRIVGVWSTVLMVVTGHSTGIGQVQQKNKKKEKRKKRGKIWMVTTEIDGRSNWQPFEMHVIRDGEIRLRRTRVTKNTKKKRKLVRLV